METITEDYVSFETAKLLKEKGFEGHSILTIYDENAANAYIKELQEKHLPFSSDDPKLKEFYYTKPTLQMAMKWLREAHNIFIVIEPHMYDYINEKNSSYVTSLWQGDNYYENITSKDYPAYEEAAEAALKYSLENLI